MIIKLTIEKQFVYIQKNEGKIVKSRLSWFKKLSCNDFIEMTRNNEYKSL